VVARARQHVMLIEIMLRWRAQINGNPS